MPLDPRHLICSPGVAFFRDDHVDLLPQGFLASVITSPAPNVSALTQPGGAALPLVPLTLRRRSARILSIAALHGHRHVILGAWGCGVFGNDPMLVRTFSAHPKEGGAFHSAFDTLIFTIRDTSPTARAIALLRFRPIIAVQLHTCSRSSGERTLIR